MKINHYTKQWYHNEFSGPKLLKTGGQISIYIMNEFMVHFPGRWGGGGGGGGGGQGFLQCHCFVYIFVYFHFSPYPQKLNDNDVINIASCGLAGSPC